MSNLNFLHRLRNEETLLLTVLIMGGLTGYSLAELTGSGATTGSGTTISEPPALTTEEQAAKEAREERLKRIQSFKQQLLKAKKEDIEETYEKERVNDAKKRAEHAAKCALELRRANRDTKLPTALRCFRGSLSANREFLRSLKKFLYGVPGVSEETKLFVLRPMDDLADALGAGIDGVDTDVFITTDDLVEARKNLAARYRMPLSAALMTLRAEKLAHALDPLIERVSALRDQEEAAGNDHQWNEVTTCFEDMQNALLAPEQKTLSMNEAEKLLSLCLEKLDAEERAFMRRPAVSAPEDSRDSSSSSAHAAAAVSSSSPGARVSGSYSSVSPRRRWYAPSDN